MKRNVVLAPRVDKEQADKERLTCRHYWIIEKAMGPSSRGVCKYCRVKRDFSNFIPDYQWDSGLFNKPGSGLPVLDDVRKEAVSVN
ncbi:MAG: hypothetical protein WC333_08390 [Dehalococcoidia bacterium]|jgi:hypothetical protein